MAKVPLKRFPGLGLRERSSLSGPTTPAKQALNCNLFGGTVRSIKGNTLTENGHTGPNFIKFGGSFVSGLDSPLDWSFDSLDLLFFKDAGEWKKRVNNVVSTLGIKRPEAPQLDDLSIPKAEQSNIQENQNHPSGLSLKYAEYVYYISYSRIVEGREIEGPLSEPIQVSPYFAPEEVSETHPNATKDQTNGKFYDLTGKDLRYHVIERPIITDSTIVHWNVYRSDDDDIPKLIAQASATGAGEGFDTVTDITVSEARGRDINELRNTTEEKYYLSYVITWERNVGGMLDESGPSSPLAIAVDNIGVKITRPTSIPTNVIKWNIYRISTDFDSTNELQLVRSLDISQSFYDDFRPNSELTKPIPTSFETSEGVLVNYDKPPVFFDGLAGPYRGMLVGWKDDALYLSRPGKPDAWNDQVKFNATSKIVSAIVSDHELIVLTTKGMQRGIGTDPIDFYLSETANEEGAVGEKAHISSESGIFYLSHSGLIQIIGSSPRNITDPILGREYFSKINLNSVFMNYISGILYVFHDQGVLRLDVRDGQFTELSDVYIAAYRDNENGVLQVLKDGAIYSLETSEDDLPKIYETGDSVYGDEGQKRFRELEFYGKGSFTVTVIIDDEEVAQRQVDLNSMRRNRIIKTNRNVWGRSLRVRVQGIGEWNAMDTHVEIKPL